MTAREEVLATLDHYAQAYCAKDTDGLMSLFDAGDDITVIGTGDDEICTGHDQIRDLFNRNFAEATAHRFEHHWIATSIRDNTAVVATTLTIHLDNDNDSVPLQVPLRWTVTLHHDGGRWLWLHRHASTSARTQDDGQAYPTDQAAR